jgi:low temperature requirement protein LtrA
MSSTRRSIAFSPGPAMATEARRPAGGIGGAIAAAEAKARRSMLRNHGGGYAAVSSLELFFDLIFVFAVTQLSHFLLADLSFAGAYKTAMLFAAVWWAWMYTTWATNWVDPDRAPNRLMLGSLMLASLIMSSAIPAALGTSGLAFALSYVAVQVGRSVYVSRVMSRKNATGSRNLLRVSLWFLASAPLWLWGAIQPDVTVRVALWSLALAIEYCGPFVQFTVPGLGHSRVEDWDISGSHMAERCGLFIIIALGEGLVITGATYAAAKGQPGLNLALLNAFLGTFAMWWLYFDMGARRGARHIEQHAIPGLIARQAFTYWHIPIVAGIIVLAVGDELLLAHPLAPVDVQFVAVVYAGTVLFLTGLAAFKRISSGNPWYPASHTYGLGLATVIAGLSWWLHPSGLILIGATAALFVLIAVWEWGSFHGGWLEPMERRGWWIGKVIRARINRRRAERLAREAERG